MKESVGLGVILYTPPPTYLHRGDDESSDLNGITATG